MKQIKLQIYSDGKCWRKIPENAKVTNGFCGFITLGKEKKKVFRYFNVEDVAFQGSKYLYALDESTFKTIDNCKRCKLYRFDVTLKDGKTITKTISDTEIKTIDWFADDNGNIMPLFVK